MSATREDVVREALRWEGTPYHDHARILGVGVDCAQLPCAVYEAVGLVPHLEPRYPRQWFLHRDEERFLEWVRPHATEISREQAGPGDLGIWRFGRTYSHSAIIIDPPVVLHAVRLGGAVMRADMGRDIDLVSRPALFFTLWPED
jgi:cell wall-associated NlpC family hydrolase